MKVTQYNTALAMGSGDLQVLATPAMVAMMENAAMKEAAKLCTEEQTTVGTLVNIAHTRPSPIGATIEATAELLEQDGRKLTYKVTAVDDKGEIGHGEHQRFIVDRTKFMSKL